MLQSNIPLSQRIYRSIHNHGAGLEATHHTDDRSSAGRMVGYKEWTYDQMDKAIQAVIDNGINIRQAAEEFNVPKSTLGDRISGRTLHGAKSGRSKYLSDEEEDILVKFLLKCASIGYPHSRKEVIALVQRFCDSRDMNVQVTHGWWEKYCLRHPEISLRTTSALLYARAKGQNTEALFSYFDILEDTFSEHKLHDKPALIFNMDETGLPLSPAPIKGVCKKGTKTPNSITSGDKSQITVIGCVSAAGHCIPPMIIWDRKTLQADMTKGELPGTIYGLSSKGWVDQELFQIWFEFHFLRYAPPIRPILLLMDGHSSHYCPDTVFLAAKEKVILFTLPPNTTHLTQPLDKGCFGPLKSVWRKTCHDFMAENPGKVVSRYSFCSVFATAWLQAMTMKNIIAGFRVTGIFPIDRHKLIHVESPRPSRLDSVDPAYLPMLSPTPHTKMATSKTVAFSDTAPDTEFETTVVVYSKQSMPIEKMLKYPSPIKSCNNPATKSTPSKNYSSRVLTSSENLAILEEKQKKKEEEFKKKEERLLKKKQKGEGCSYI